MSVNVTNPLRDTLEAVRRSPRDADAWFRLGSILEKEQYVVVGSKGRNRRDCLARSLTLRPNNARAWFLLGVCDRDYWEPDLLLYCVGDERFSMRMCLGRSLELDESDAEVWCEAGQIVSNGNFAVLINEKPYTTRDCLVRALELLPGFPTRLDVEICAWSALCDTFSGCERVTIGVNSYDKVSCLQHLIEVVPGNRRLWMDLSTELVARGLPSIVVGGIKHTPSDCCVKALELCPFDSAVWRQAVNVSTERTCINVLGTHHTLTECRVLAHRYESHAEVAIAGLLEVIRRLTRESSEWKRWVGTRLLESGSTLTAEGKTVGPRECFVSALADGLDLHNHRNASTWGSLASTMKSGETVEVAGVSFTREDCQRFSQSDFHEVKKTCAYL